MHRAPCEAVLLPAPRCRARGPAGQRCPLPSRSPARAAAHCDSARPRPRRAPAAPPPANGHSAAAPANQRARLCPPSLAIGCLCPSGIAHWLLPEPVKPLAPPRCLPQMPGSSSGRVGPAPFLQPPPPIGCEERPFRAAIGGGEGRRYFKKGLRARGGSRGCEWSAGVRESLASCPGLTHREGSEGEIYPRIPHEGLRTLRVPRPWGHCLARGADQEF